MEAPSGYPTSGPRVFAPGGKATIATLFLAGRAADAVELLSGSSASVTREGVTVAGKGANVAVELILGGAAVRAF